VRNSRREHAAQTALCEKACAARAEQAEPERGNQLSRSVHGETKDPVNLLQPNYAAQTAPRASWQQ